jgi:hypothetical protein
MKIDDLYFDNEEVTFLAIQNKIIHKTADEIQWPNNHSNELFISNFHSIHSGNFKKYSIFNDSTVVILIKNNTIISISKLDEKNMKKVVDTIRGFITIKYLIRYIDKNYNINIMETPYAAFPRITYDGDRSPENANLEFYVDGGSSHSVKVSDLGKKAKLQNNCLIVITTSKSGFKGLKKIYNLGFIEEELLIELVNILKELDKQ